MFDFTKVLEWFSTTIKKDVPFLLSEDLRFK